MFVRKPLAIPTPSENAYYKEVSTLSCPVNGVESFVAALLSTQRMKKQCLLELKTG